MKLKHLLSVASIATILASPLQGATNVSYSASAAPSSDPDANSGTVNVWTTSTTTVDGNQAGFFLGNSADNGGNAGAGTSAWATYANSNQETFSSHSFGGGALNVGQTVNLDFDHGGIADTKSTGIQLFNGSTLLFQFYFRGGQSNYEYLDNTGSDLDISAGFTTNGGTLSFTLLSATTYSASWLSEEWTGSIQNLGIDRIQVYNNSAGGGGGSNVYFNNLTVIPEPASVALGLMGTMLLLRRRK